MSKKPKLRTPGAEPLEERLPVSASLLGVIAGAAWAGSQKTFDTTEYRRDTTSGDTSFELDALIALHPDALSFPPDDTVEPSASIVDDTSSVENRTDSGDSFLYTALGSVDTTRQFGDDFLLTQISATIDTTQATSLPLVGENVRAANREFWQNAFSPDSEWRHDTNQPKFEEAAPPIRPLIFYDSRCDEVPQVEGALLIDVAEDAEEESLTPSRSGGSGQTVKLEQVSSSTNIVEKYGATTVSGGDEQEWFVFDVTVSGTCVYNVYLQLEGTATWDQDYIVRRTDGSPVSVTGNSFFLPISGGTSMEFKVIPVNDTIVEVDETINVSIQPDPFGGASSGSPPAYIIVDTKGNIIKAADSTITVTILDDDRLKVDLDVDSDNDGVLSRSDDEDKIEASSPGKLIRASKTSAVENREPMVLEISGTCIVPSAATVTLAIPSPFKVYSSDTGTNSEIVSGTYSLKQLGLAPDVPLTFYVGATAPSAVDDGVITVTVDPDGPGPLSPESDTVILTSYDLIIDARNSITLPDGSKAAPLMWNDNWDNGKTYDANVLGHREHEPIWDRDYDPAIYGPLEEADDDLMSTFITILPADLPGTFELTFGSGVKLWEDNLKSAPIESGTPYTADTIPKSFDTEGIEVGSENITLVYKYNDRIQDTTTLRADVVWLKAEQDSDEGFVQKVIYENSQIIFFQVVGLPSEYTCQWDLAGDGTYNSGWIDPTTNNLAIVQYSPAANGPTNIYLEEIVANRRKEYEVTAKLTGGYVLPLMFGTIRVAQSTYQGEALKGALKSGESDDDPDVIARRRIEVAGLAALPAMDTLPTSGPFSASILDAVFGTAFGLVGNAFIQYSTGGLDDVGGAFSDGRGTSMKSYGAMITAEAYFDNKREDLQAIALHEVRHVNQQAEIKTAGTKWNTIDTNYPNFKDPAYFALYEADALIANLTSQASWKFMITEFENQDGNFNYLGLFWYRQEV